MDTTNNSLDPNETNFNSILSNVTTQESYSLCASITLWIWKIFPTILLAIGTFGNVTTIIVLLRQKLRNNAPTLDLLVLAITDLTVLYFGLLRQYLTKIHDIDLRVIMGCGFHIWIVYTSVAYSSWLLVAMTMDRVISVKFPFYVRNRNTRRCNLIVIITLFLVIGILNSHFIYGWERREYTLTGENTTIKYMYCDIKSSFSHLHNTVWPWVDLFLASIIPFLFVGIGNCFIGYNLITRENTERLQRRIGSHNKRNSVSQQRSIAKLLVVLSIVFFVTTFPVSIYIVIYLIVFSDETKEMLELFWAIVSFLMYTNNAINFILYCATANNFRHEFKTMLKEKQWICHVFVQTCVRQQKKQTLTVFDDAICNTREHNKASSSFGEAESGLTISTVSSVITDEL